MKFTREQISFIVVVLAIGIICYYKPKLEAYTDKNKIVNQSQQYSTRLVWLPDADLIYMGEGEGPIKVRTVTNTTARTELKNLLMIDDSKVIDIAYRPLQNDSGLIYYVDKGTEPVPEFEQYLIDGTEESIGLYFMSNRVNLPYNKKIKMANALLKFIPIA